MLIRIWLLAVLALVPLPAQFDSVSARFDYLVAPGNGADVYFRIARPLKGSGQPEQGRIFKIGSTPLTLVAAVTNNGVPKSCATPFCSTSYYDLASPDVSGDGTVVAYSGTAYCGSSNSFCLQYFSLVQTTVEGVPGKGTLTFPGLGRLSRDGRHLAYFTSRSDGSTDLNSIDITSGAQLAHATANGWFTAFAPQGRVVADDGSFVANIAGFQNVFRGGKVVQVPAQNAADAVIDASGQTVVYNACCSPYWELRIFHPDTSEDSVLLQPNGNADSPVITADGQQVAFLSPVKFGTTDPPGSAYQVCIMNIDGTGIRVLTNDPDGVAWFTLSDDGQNAWYVSMTGALTQVNTATGQGRQLLLPPLTASLGSFVSPGSAVSLDGGGLDSIVRVTFDGIPAPILSRNSAEMWVQAPWELQSPKSAVAVAIQSGNPSPFEETSSLTTSTLPLCLSYLSLAIHQDWSGYVTQAKPALGGEILYLYAAGLGPVQPPVATGAPGPKNPLAVLTTPLNCNMPVIFAGLAPGLVGYYLLYVQMPAIPTAGVQNLSCAGQTWRFISTPP